MIDEKKITEAVDAYIGYPKEVGEGVDVSMRRDAFREGAKWFKEAIWHDAKEEPEIDKTLIIQYTGILNEVSYDKDRHVAICPWELNVKRLRILKWFYIDDILPKGGDK